MDSNTTTYTKTFSIDLERTNYHRNLKLKRRKRLIVVLIIWLIIFVYMITPLSRVNLKVSGNVYYTKDELVDMGYINENRLWWLFDENKAIKTLESDHYIENVEIHKSLFGTKMNVKEIYPVGLKNNKYVMSNGDLIDREAYSNHSKITNIASFDNIDEVDIDNLVNKYSKIDLEIRNDFYKVEIVESNEYKYVKLYGNKDNIGFFVIKADLVYLDIKFKGNKYDKIIEEISKNNVKYSEDNPCFVAYHLEKETDFRLVDGFEEE